MNQLRIAVIGGGISGVVAAHYLAKRHQVVLFEAEERLGGHTNTIDIPGRLEFGSDAGLPVDTGFIVYNDRTYPNFIRFLTELGIKGSATEMSFSYYDQARDRAYAGTNLAGLFACRRNLVSPGFWSFLASVARFNLRAARDVKRGGLEGIGLEEYLLIIKAPPRLQSDYLGPMTQAIWSVPEGGAMAYPAETFIRFFDNHGLLSIPGRITWRYLKGGSRIYLKEFQSRFSGEIHLGAPVSAVERPADGIPKVHFKGGAQRFDAVVIAAHADQALSMLHDADQRERSILGPWRYNRNRTVLHNDQRHMPPLKRAWACWNVSRRAGDDEKRPVRITYWMNRLQKLAAINNWLVSLNADQDFAPSSTVYETIYEHPVYNLESVAAQKELPSISGPRRTYFCGAYHGYGFHEDGAKSAVELVRKHFGVEP